MTETYSENIEINNVEVTVECANCHKTIKKDDAKHFERDDEYYCIECFEELFTICHDCGETVYIDDTREAFNNLYCEECFRENFYTCEICGDVIRNDELVSSS